jgi:hypothetical protein
MSTFAYALVACTGLIYTESGKLACLDELKVFHYRPFHSTVNSDAFFLELLESSVTDATDDDGVNGVAPEGHQRLAFAVGMIKVMIVDNIRLAGF